MASESQVKIANYETLINKPEVTLRELCEFINIQYKDRMIKNIYASSVKKNPEPNLPDELSELIANTWKPVNTQITDWTTIPIYHYS